MAREELPPRDAISPARFPLNCATIDFPLPGSCLLYAHSVCNFAPPMPPHARASLLAAIFAPQASLHLFGPSAAT